MGAGDPRQAALREGPASTAYVPRLLPAWAAAELGPAHRVVDGSLLLFDITGFTPLTERLARRGREGAEELSNLLDDVFGRLLTGAEDEGGDLLKWGGDALLLFFDGPDHGCRAARAALRMQRVLAQIGRATTSIGRVKLRASAGVESGPVHLVLAGNPAAHRELVVLGPTATGVTMLEHAAGTGEVLLGDATAADVGPELVRPHHGLGHLLAGVPTPPPNPPRQPEPEPMAAVLEQLLPPQLLAYLDQPSREPEHRTVAVAFLRFDGTDTVLAEDGAEALTTAVDEVLRNVQQATAAHDIAFLDTDVDADGGKILLVGGAPRSAGDDTDRLLTAVCEIVNRDGRLPLRAGISQGRVFTGETGSPSRKTYSVKGDTVNLAARLAAYAESGSILMAADVLEHTRRSYAVNDAPVASLKGKSRPVPVVTLLQPLEPRRQQDTGDVLVGRAAEMAVLKAATEQVINGSGSVVEVVGEPGNGKTRLVDEAVSQASEVTALRCDCERTGAETPYAPVRRLLHEVLGTSSAMDPNTVAKCLQDCVTASAPELGPWASLLGVVLDVTLPASPEVAELEEQHRAERIPELVADLLERMVPIPAMLVVEDAHLADPASAGVLAAMGRRTQQQPWLLLATREDRPTGWVPTDAQRIELGPLDVAASTELAEMATPDRPLPPAIAEALAARAGGHPLLLRELARAVARGEDPDELPSTVEELAATQIDRLPAAQRSLLRRAAVLGDEFNEDLLLRMAGDQAAEQSADELLAGLAGLIVATDGQLRFRHPILREVAYAGLPYRRRRELHAQAAEVLETTSAAADRPEILALHYFVAGRYDKAMDYGWRAGEKAMARYAPAAAADAYRRAAQAARLSPGVSPSERSFYLEALGDAEFLAGRPTEAAAAYVEALRGVRGQPLREAHLALKHSLVEQRRGHYSNALRRASLGLRAIGAVTGPEAGAVRAQLQVRYAFCRVQQGRYADARRWAERGLTEAEAAHELKAQAKAHAVLHALEVASGGPDAELHGETALRILEQLGDLTEQAHMWNNMAVQRLAEGRWPDALLMFGRAADMYRRIGDASNAASSDSNRAEVLVGQGRSDEALPLLQNSLRVARAVGDEDLAALARKEMGKAQSRAGDVAAGLILLEQARAELTRLREPQEVVDADIAAAEAHLLAGRPEQALILVEGAVKEATSIHAARLLPSAYRVQAAALFAMGQVAQARTALARGLRQSSSPEVAHERGFLLAVAARIARQVDDPDAELLAEQAREALELLGVVRVPLPELS
ncbi:MAG TPA: adenylate/guanylate cyclase domain-containing protein [Propionibacteriaceae bacterium]|nr:adenylate/guanylate cyclase domain-containing protein [Propionibacteriaceae bacterium]